MSIGARLTGVNDKVESGLSRGTQCPGAGPRASSLRRAFPQPLAGPDGARPVLSCTVEDIEGPAVWPDPELCQQFGCSREAETWCPLCRAYLCLEHDELVPVRKHDCLRGRAEAA